MTDAGRHGRRDADATGPSYLSAGHSLRSWLFTLDHKRIAILYLISVTAFFVVGGLAAGAVRVELIKPRGTFMSNEMYNRMFTLHGVVMIFFFLIPAIPAVLGNLLVPLMVGARDLAFPRLNLLSWYLYTAGGLCALTAAVSGGVDTGWTFYTPYSTFYTNSQVTLTIAGAFIAGFSSIATGINFIVTIHKMRAPGQTWFRLPLFIWAQYATSIIIVLGTPVVAITLLLVVAERVAHIGVFDPKYGGDPVLFQHLFWFYSHPAVYIMILPAMGVISEVIACFSRKRIFGYHFVAGSSLAIAALGFLVWGHHMFVSGQSMYAGMVFSFLSFLVAIPSAVKVFNWTATIYKGSVSFDAPPLFAFCFIGLFLIGGLTGLFLASLATDVHLTHTYFVVAHFHYVMVGGAISAYFAGIHFWWPKITGRMYPETIARIAAVILFIGFHLTFLPQFVMGFVGMPRRYHYYPPEFQTLHVLSTAGSTVMALAYLLPVVYLLWSLRYGRRASANPWGATGLEWEIASPPPTHNFDSPPRVTGEPYDYEALCLSENPPTDARRRATCDPTASEPRATGERSDGGPS
ncbi:MAG: cytochrome c oxidase subunit I [Armatimonadetes bacterium]|nr:cytochrome c oxidase subunit I [Armatimonadota bacterium]